MEIEVDRPVGEIADAVPHAARVFEILGINYCDRRERTLRDAAAAARVDLEELQQLLLRRTPPPRGMTLHNAAQTPLRAVTRHIVEHHHRRARRTLVDLSLLAGQVASAHAAMPAMLALHDAITRLARTLIPHMRNEEQYVFPYIDSIEREIGPDETIMVPLFGTIEYPLQAIRHDHSEDLAVVAGLREAAHNFSPPHGACDNVRALYRMLEEFEVELHEHVLLENDVLFPRAVEAEKRAARGHKRA